MSLLRADDCDSARAWWEGRRLLYNGGLVFAGMGSLTLHAAILELSSCRLNEQDLSPITLVARAGWYLGAMVLANLAYSLAPLFEERVRPASPGRFRNCAFSLWFGISFVLPFTVPVLFIAHC